MPSFLNPNSASLSETQTEVSEAWSDAARAAAAAARGSRGKSDSARRVITARAYQKAGGDALAKFKNRSSATADQDPLNTPASYVDKVTRRRINISSDDGNESSYGGEKWKRSKTTLKLQKAWGRDTFEGNLADGLNRTKRNPEGYAKKGDKISIGRFRRALTDHMKSWKQRSKAAAAFADEED